MLPEATWSWTWAMLRLIFCRVAAAVDTPEREWLPPVTGEP